MEPLDVFGHIGPCCIECRVGCAVGRPKKSQTALSELLGWPQQRLSAAEAGARRLDVLEFLQLMRALGLTPEGGIGLVTHAEAKSSSPRPTKRTL